jgi:hypothetical protein
MDWLIAVVTSHLAESKELKCVTNEELITSTTSTITLLLSMLSNNGYPYQERLGQYEW